MYLDTSFLLKAYVSEAESEEATTLLNELRGDGVVSLLSDLEVVSALSRRLSVDDGKRIIERYRANRSQGLFRQVGIDDDVYALAASLASQYAKRFSLRSLDLLHLATTLHHEIPSLGTYDKPLADAASALGLIVLPGRS